MKKLSLVLICFIGSLDANVGLDYLNLHRTKAGMPIFSEQSNLRAAAQNHSAYMQTNEIAAHVEDASKTGYTGEHALDRAQETGYLAGGASENISAGQSNIQNSIDGLFSAIYHRFGFLSLQWDEAGIGISNNKNYYTYNMGNSVWNGLCSGSASTSGYKNVCKDTNKIIDATAYNTREDEIKNKSQNIIVWPAVNSDDIPPVFYEETPDPLPDYGLSGYPVSVEFNSKNDFNTSLLDITSFTLEDMRGTVVDAIVVMDKENDPNGRFTEYQYALFPEDRLEWGSKYTAELIYNYKNTTYTKKWNFATKSLRNKANRFYRIANDNNISLAVISGQSYAIYVVPNNGNDTLGSLNYSYTSDAPIFVRIDRNTFNVKITGAVGESVSMSFANNQKIKFTISESDTATLPLRSSCCLIDYDHDGIPDSEDLDDDNDGISDKDEKANGLNPLDASDAKKDFDKDGFSNAIEILLGSNVHEKSSHPTWTPVMMGELIIFIPSFK